MLIKPASGLKIFPGREQKRSGAEIRSGKVECGENVDENASPKRHRTVRGDTGAAARTTGRQSDAGTRNVSGRNKSVRVDEEENIAPRGACTGVTDRCDLTIMNGDHDGAG